MTGRRAPEGKGPHGAPGRAEAGFVLPAVLLTLVAVGALAAAGFMLTRTDFQVGLNQRTAVRADNVAQRGLAEYLADRSEIGGDETYVFGGDTAVVTVTRLLEVGPTYADSLFRLTSEGIYRVGDRRARRVVSLLVMEAVDRLTLASALAGGGTVETGGSSRVRGDDQCGGPSAAGVAVASGGYYLGGSGDVEGSPPVDSSYASPTAVLQATGVDWEALVRDTIAEPDYWIPADSWPDFGALPSNEYPFIRVTSSSYTLNDAHTGRGTILLEGDVAVEESFHWEGLMLVGGDFISTGNADIRGGVVVGLNLLLAGGTEGVVDMRGSSDLRYGSCHVTAAASQAFRWPVVVPGGWTEEMSP